MGIGILMDMLFACHCTRVGAYYLELRQLKQIQRPLVGVPTRPVHPRGLLSQDTVSWLKVDLMVRLTTRTEVMLLLKCARMADQWLV